MTVIVQLSMKKLGLKTILLKLRLVVVSMANQ